MGDYIRDLATGSAFSILPPFCVVRRVREIYLR
jgi:hypothetical protein